MNACLYVCGCVLGMRRKWQLLLLNMCERTLLDTGVRLPSVHPKTQYQSTLWQHHSLGLPSFKVQSSRFKTRFNTSLLIKLTSLWDIIMFTKLECTNISQCQQPHFSCCNHYVKFPKLCDFIHMRIFSITAWCPLVKSLHMRSSHSQLLKYLHEEYLIQMHIYMYNKSFI